MLLKISLAAFFSLALLIESPAQSLLGKYELVTPQGVVELTISPDSPAGLAGTVELAGVPIDGETMWIDPETGFWINAQGTIGEMTVLDGGDLEIEVQSGPNNGRRTIWKRL